MEAEFLDHYQRELEYIRDLSGEFARQYPAVAGRLGMDEFACADPYVERLLEGFAFLAARVHLRIDAEFPRFTEGLLDAVYPHFTRPIPSATLVSFEPQSDEGSLADGYHLPRGTSLRGPASDHQPTPCRFDTTESLELWPIRLVDVALVPRDAADGRPMPIQFQRRDVRSCLRLTIETTAGIPMSALALDRLKWRFRGGEVAHRLHELVIAHTTGIAVTGNQGISWSVPKDQLPRAEGIADDQAMLPHEPRSFSGFRLLQEYFLLPEKFLAVSISGLQAAIPTATGTQLQIVIALDECDRELIGRVGVENLALHCVPAINLFPKRADRIQISNRHYEHQLLVDRSRPQDFEIWSVQQLCGHGETPQQELEFLPLYAPPEQRQNERTATMRRYWAYYTLQRRPRQPSMNQRQHGHRSPYLGSEVFVTLTDSQQQPAQHEIRQLSSTVYCTNRDLAMLTPPGGWSAALSLSAAGPVQGIECLVPPTPPRVSLASQDGDACWRLVNHLTPNHLAMGEPVVKRAIAPGPERSAGTPGQTGAAMLRETLNLYCPPGHASGLRQIDGIVSVRHRNVTRQLPCEGPIVHGRGIEIELEIDDAAFEGTSPFLLASVLEQYFARFVTLNSFTQLALRTVARERVYRWPVRLGTAELL